MRERISYCDAHFVTGLPGRLRNSVQPANNPLIAQGYLRYYCPGYLMRATTIFTTATTTTITTQCQLRTG